MPVETYALVKEGVVTNVVLWDKEAVPKAVFDGEPVLCTGLVVAPGHAYDGKNFIAPPREDPLPAAKTGYTALVEAAFGQLQGSMFVDSAKRESLRSSALYTVGRIKAATTVEGVLAAAQAGIEELQGLAKR